MSQIFKPVNQDCCSFHPWLIVWWGKGTVRRTKHNVVILDQSDQELSFFCGKLWLSGNSTAGIEDNPSHSSCESSPSWSPSRSKIDGKRQSGNFVNSSIGFVWNVKTTMSGKDNHLKCELKWRPENIIISYAREWQSWPWSHGSIRLVIFETNAAFIVILPFQTKF